MDYETAVGWKEKIKGLAYEAGFVAVGFTTADPVAGLKEFLEERFNLGWHTSFEERDLQKRVDPRLTWPLCKTVVVLAYSLPFSKRPKEGEGIIARSAVGEDYHIQVKRALDRLSNSLLEAGWPGEKPQFQVDTGPLNERALAVRAGLGWIGKNQHLIIPGIGSFVALALLLLNQALPPDKPLPNQCGQCTLCLQACPARILGARQFQANRCLSYLTQSKEVLTKEQQLALGRRIFGCDTCQEVCPHNRSYLAREAELNAELDTELMEAELVKRGDNKLLALEFTRGVNLWETLQLTQSTFKSKWKSTAAGWRGKGILQRNAYFALKNIQDPRLKEWEQNSNKDRLPVLLQQYVGNNVDNNYVSNNQE